MRKKSLMRTTVVSAALAAGLAGCGGAANDSASSSDNAAFPAAAPAAASGAETAPEGGGSAADAPAAAAPAAAPAASTPERGASTAGRTVLHPQALIITVGRTVRVKDVAKAVKDAAALTKGLGGRVEGEDGSEDPETRAAAPEQMVLRIPPTKVDPLVEGLESAGDVLTRTRKDTDVTQQVQDVLARLANARASVARVREFYSEADGVKEIVLMEGELSRRVADLESLEAQSSGLSDSTTLATVTVTFVGTDVVIADTATDKGFVAGLDAGWDAFVASVVVVLTVLGAVLPFVPLVLALLGLAWWARRQLRRRASGVTTVAS